MRSIEITFHQNTDLNQQKIALKKIKSWKSIESAGHLMEDSVDDNIKRMAFAYVADEADIKAVSQKLKSLPEIETAVFSAQRHL
jgi:hypothetical protein